MHANGPCLRTIINATIIPRLPPFCLFLFFFTTALFHLLGAVYSNLYLYPVPAQQSRNTMDDADMKACLAKLADVLGVQVPLGDPQEPLSDEDEEVQPIAAVFNASSNKKEAAKSEKIGRNVESDAPVKFQLHDVGPRPCTDGAFDQHHKVGERADKDVEFCPWKVITEYPDHFIGKTNRPHVFAPRDTQVCAWRLTNSRSSRLSTRYLKAEPGICKNRRPCS
jgi:hypothetical protein